MEKTVKEDAIGMLYENFIAPISHYPNHEMWDAILEYPRGSLEDLESNMGMLIEQLIKDEKLKKLDKRRLNIEVLFCQGLLSIR